MTARRKVLFISSWFPNRLHPLDGNFVQRHAEAVSTLHDVEVLHVVPDLQQKQLYQIEENTINGIHTVTVYYQDSGNPFINNIRKFSAYKKGLRLVQQPEIVHANVLHTNLLFALWLKKKYGIPYVVTEHFTDYRPINLQNLSTSQKMIAKLIGNNASMIFPVTTDLRKGLKKLGIEVPMKVVPNVVNSAVFKPQNGITDGRAFTFLHISNLVPRKNPDKIVAAARELMQDGCNIRLLIGGDAAKNDAELLKRQISDSGFQNRIELFGQLTSEKVASKMNEADCFILFSEDENQPCVISESFYVGIPVISSDVGGISEFFPDRFGVLIEQRTVENLKIAMQKVMDGKNLALQEELTAYADATFSVEGIAQQYSDSYLEILNEKFR